MRKYKLILDYIRILLRQRNFEAFKLSFDRAKEMFPLRINKMNERKLFKSENLFCPKDTSI